MADRFIDDVFVIEMPEGGSLSDARIQSFTGFPGRGEEKKQPIRFIVKTIAFVDEKDPDRNWANDEGRIFLPSLPSPDASRVRLASYLERHLK